MRGLLCKLVNVPKARRSKPCQLQERETGERAQEHMGATEKVVEVAQPRAPCQ